MKTFLLPAVLILIAACASGPQGPTSDVVGEVPWQAGESLSYVLKDGNGKELGQTVLSVARDGDDWKLTAKHASATNTDTSIVVVSGETLKPISSQRTIVRPDDTDEITVTYSADGALIKQGDKQSGLSVPNHAYDNDSSLFLWRTVSFAEGYVARYVTIITNRRSRQTVELKVAGKEDVTVPAGTFTSWRLEITTSNAKQTAWIADIPSRPLVKYDNDRGTVFELTSTP